MKLLTSLSEFDWIAEGISKVDAKTQTTVAHCIPPVFPSYAKILHSIYEDLSVRDRRLTWQQEEAGTPLDHEPMSEGEEAIASVLSRSTLVYGAATPDASLKRIRWAELAGRLGMRFTPTLSAASFTRRFRGRSWPRHLIGPMEGGLADFERDALKSVLSGQTGVDRVLFRFWLLATTRWEGDKIFEGTLDEVSFFPDEDLGVRFTPTHWYPEDRSWIVCSDYDLTFSLVGGAESLIQRLLDHPILECVRVSLDTRVDWNADLKNVAH